MSSFPIPDVSDFITSLSDDAKSILSSGGEPKSLEAAVSHLALALPGLDSLDYIKHVILPALETNISKGERLYLPMIDQGNASQNIPGFSKEHALPYLFWGLLYENWAPPEFGSKEDTGVSVFIQGYENRSKGQADDPSMPDNMRKRIYYSALTSDLMGKYSPKVASYFDALFDEQNSNKPLMREYLDSYSNLYWNLHLSSTGAEIPPEVIDIQKSFNTVLAYASPINPSDHQVTMIFHDNYINVRNLRQELFDWLDCKIEAAKNENDDTTFVFYWLQNSDQGKSINFRSKDIRFECFHNFVALSQWGNTIYNIMSLLSPNSQDPQASVVKEWFERTMHSPCDSVSNVEAFSPLDRFIMELFRYISPNTSSISVVQQNVSPFPRYGYVSSPHKATSELAAHWLDPTTFNPERYLTAPTSSQNNAARSQEIGFAQCPFSKESFAVKDGRNAELTNSIFGTVYGVVEGKDNPVCDYAGYAPFGFGYRRCPGELLNIEVFKVFFEKVWNDGIKFYNLSPEDPQLVPVGPGAVVPDIFGFRR